MLVCYDGYMTGTDYDTVEFPEPDGWRQWLDAHHADTDGIWLKMYKKATGIKTITYAEALDAALCYGWIDGQMKKADETAYLQKFTPRRKNSMWSKRNIEYIARLEAAGLMMPAGRAEVDRAQADGRWDAAYDKPSEMIMPDYFLEALDKNPKAKAFFATLNKTNTYAIAWRLQTAKTEVTRQRRLEKLIAMLEANQKLHY
jgi:uncharacterized protein YdeI (YjbR/CyaY-like superfamily)